MSYVIRIVLNGQNSTRKQSIQLKIVRCLIPPTRLKYQAVNRTSVRKRLPLKMYVDIFCGCHFSIFLDSILGALDSVLSDDFCRSTLP